MAFFDKFKKEEINGARDYDEDLLKNRIALLIIPTKRYQAELLHLTKNLADKCSCNKIAYVSLNKPAENARESLRKYGVDAKILFIDAVTKGVKPDISDHGISYITPPNKFEQFKTELIQVLEKEKLDCLIFDSLSTMLVYEDQNTIIKFAHDLITRLMMASAHGKFTCLAEDVDSMLIKDISMFVDKVIDLSEKLPAEKKDLEKEVRISKFEVELDAVRKAYAANLLSETSYLATKKRIEDNLRKLGKKGYNHG